MVLGAAKQSEGEHLVSRPYFDKGGANISMVSVTRPIYDVEGAFVGVAGVDLAMVELVEVVRPFIAATDAGDHTVRLPGESDERVFAHPDQVRTTPRAPKRPTWTCRHCLRGQASGERQRQALQRIQLPYGEVVQDLLDIVRDSRLEGRSKLNGANQSSCRCENKLVAVHCLGFLFLALMVWLSPWLSTG